MAEIGTVTIADRESDWVAFAGGVATFAATGTKGVEKVGIILEWRPANATTASPAALLDDLTDSVDIEKGAGHVRVRLSGGDADTDIDAYLTIPGESITAPA